MLRRLGLVVAIVLTTVVFTANQALACESSGDARQNGVIDFGVKCPKGVGDEASGGEGGVIPVVDGKPESPYDRCMRLNNSTFICATLPLIGPTIDPPPDTPDASELAQKAKGRIRFLAPKIGMSPLPPNPAVVNLQTWLWIEGGNWRPLVGSVAAGGATVTATAEPVSVRWDMGEGAALCQGPGTKWRKGLGQGVTSSCGFTYRHTSIGQSGGAYKIAATIRYVGSWTCEGDCSDDGGDLGLLDSPVAVTNLEVTERQTVVQ